MVSYLLGSRCVEIIRNIEEMAEDESLCKYCDSEPGWHMSGGGTMYSCEGSYCKKAYERYLDELEISERVVTIKNKTKVTIERI